ncbi:MAG: BON domain-containing protein [Planctomycetaceae bacterium]|nr:BON domain-containing protein [Planctomycetaceae bacterium]
MLQSISVISPAADSELAARVKNNLALQHIPGVRWLEVHAHHGVVTLRGRVQSFYNRQRCVHCSQHVAGVYSLIDQLEVTEPGTSGQSG